MMPRARVVPLRLEKQNQVRGRLSKVVEFERQGSGCRRHHMSDQMERENVEIAARRIVLAIESEIAAAAAVVVSVRKDFPVSASVQQVLRGWVSAVRIRQTLHVTAAVVRWPIAPTTVSTHALCPA